MTDPMYTKWIFMSDLTFAFHKALKIYALQVKREPLSSMMIMFDVYHDERCR